MDVRTVYITEFDRERLRALLNDAKRLDRHGNEYLNSLESELSRAQIIAPAAVPADVITMNTGVCLRDLDTQEEMTMILVFPRDADITQAKISVLAPIGAAILGYRVGDVFTWNVPDGVRRLQVEEVLYQPEAAGAHHL